MKWLKMTALALVAGTLGACAPTVYAPAPPRVYGYSYAPGCVWVPGHRRAWGRWVPGHWRC